MHEDNYSAGLVQEEHGYEQESTLYTEVNTVSNSNSRVITQASEIIGTSQIQPSEHYNCAVKRKEVFFTRTLLILSIAFLSYFHQVTGLELLWPKKGLYELFHSHSNIHFK